MDSSKAIWWILGAATLTVVGFIVIPPLMKKYGNRLYKKSVKSEEIDFDALAPEIVKKDSLEKGGDN